jgi:glycosyltransferase involved in cell wall biosynthesis
MNAIGRCESVEVEAICTPDYEWAQAETYDSWMGLSSISHRIPTLRRFRFLKGQFVNPLRAAQYAYEHNLDAVHFAHINHLSFPFWRERFEQSNLGVFASAHDVRRQKRILSRWWEERQLQAFYRFVDALFVHSEYQARELIDFAGVERTKIHIVPHGPYTHGTVPDRKAQIRKRWELPSDQQIALIFGQIRDDKNLDGFIQAAAHTSTPPYILIAGSEVGRHREVSYYKAVAQRSGMEHHVRFIPRYLADEEVGELFIASDWIALPYQEDFTSQSGVLNVAVHYDRPVFVGPAPVLREAVQKWDIGVACSSAAIPDMAGDIDTMAERVADGHSHEFEAYRKRHSWQENARRTVEVYRDVMTTER